MNQVPSIVGLDDIVEGWHWSAVHPGHKDAIDVLIGGTTLKAGVVAAGGKIVRTDWIVLTVGEGRRGWAVPLALRAMTLPALQLGEQSFAVGDALDGDGWLGGNFDHVAGLFLVPAGRESLDVGHQVRALLPGESVPDGHVGVSEPTPDGVVEIFVRGKCSGGCRAALERSKSEVAGLGIEPLRILTVAIAEFAMTAGAIAAEVGGRTLGVPGDFPDVTFHRLERHRRMRTDIRGILTKSQTGEAQGKTDSYSETKQPGSIHERHPLKR